MSEINGAGAGVETGAGPREDGGAARACEDVGSGTTVLLVHGHPFDRSMWKPQLDRLSHAMRLIAPDLRGYGQAALGPGDSHLSDFADDLVGLLDRERIERAVLVGLSMGGQVVLELQRRYPERVLGLVLAATSARADPPDVREARFALAERLLREGMDDYALEVLPRMMSPRTLRERPDLAKLVLSMMRRADPRGAAAALRGRAQRVDYTPHLAGIEVPTLVVVGTDDVFTPLAEATWLRDHIPRARLLVLEGVGHLPNLEAATAFNDALLRLVRRIPPVEE